MSGGNNNKGTTMGGLLGPLGALYGMQYDMQVQASKDSNDRINDEQTKIQAEQAWLRKKKGINDQNAALAALRLRGTEGTPGKSGTSQYTDTPQSTGILGGVGDVSVPTKVSKAVNSPLGL
jgi:hypothetical protein